MYIDQETFPRSASLLTNIDQPRQTSNGVSVGEAWAGGGVKKGRVLGEYGVFSVPFKVFIVYVLYRFWPLRRLMKYTILYVWPLQSLVDDIFTFCGESR